MWKSGSFLLQCSSSSSSFYSDFSSLQVLVVVVGKDGVLRLDHVLLQLSLPLLVHLDLGWGEGGHGDKLQIGVADQLASQPEEGLLEVVVRLGGDVVVLKGKLIDRRDD